MFSYLQMETIMLINDIICFLLLQVNSGIICLLNEEKAKVGYHKLNKSEKKTSGILENIRKHRKQHGHIQPAIKEILTFEGW